MMKSLKNMLKQDKEAYRVPKTVHDCRRRAMLS